MNSIWDTIIEVVFIIIQIVFFVLVMVDATKTEEPLERMKKYEKKNDKEK